MRIGNVEPPPEISNNISIFSGVIEDQLVFAFKRSKTTLNRCREQALSKRDNND